MKHIKLFESFINEELSPELKKRTYDEMMKIAKDPNAIDSSKRRNQADNVLSSKTPEVSKLISELQDHARRVLSTAVNSSGEKYAENSIRVRTFDKGLATEGLGGMVFIEVEVGMATIIKIVIEKTKYTKAKAIDGTRPQYQILENRLYNDRAFVNTLKKLIVQIQKDEIPGDEQVPEQPEAITPEGGIN
jgi:hypothetical protein